MENNLSVRELQENDIQFIADYWQNAQPDFLLQMGVDLNKIPAREDFRNMLKHQLSLPIEEKNSYCIIWEQNGTPIGHCNTNPTAYGKEAFMHLHIWNITPRGRGLGSTLLKKTLPIFFNNLKLEKLYSQPYAKNEAPNRALEKAGFTFVKEYTTVPGSLNFEQPVKLWEITFDSFQNSYS